MSEKQKLQTPSSNEPWSDYELRIAVDGYLYMLSLELSGIAFSAEDMAKFLKEGSLPKRNDASIRYRMRNISYVFSKRHLPTLKAYSPASGVGSGVRLRIEELLYERSDSLSQLAEKNRKKDKVVSEELNEVLSRLDQLEKGLSEIEATSRVGIGHNNPPEPIEQLSINFNDFRETLQSIKKELTSTSPRKDQIEKEQSILIKLCLQLITEAKDHFSVFTKTTVTVTATVVSTKMFIPQVLETLESLASYLNAL